MDYTSIGSIAGYISLAVVIIDKIVTLVNHKRLKSKCCGQSTEISLDIKDITPPPEVPFLKL